MSDDQDRIALARGRLLQVGGNWADCLRWADAQLAGADAEIDALIAEEGIEDVTSATLHDGLGNAIDITPRARARVEAGRDITGLIGSTGNLQQIIDASMRRAIADAGDADPAGTLDRAIARRAADEFHRLAEAELGGQAEHEAAPVAARTAWVPITLEAMVDGGIPLTPEQQVEYDRRERAKEIRIARWNRSWRGRWIRLRWAAAAATYRARHAIAARIDYHHHDEDDD